MLGATTCSGWNDDPSDRCTNEMPAFESRRVRTQPLTVTGASFGASPTRISRTLNARLSVEPPFELMAFLPFSLLSYRRGPPPPTPKFDPPQWVIVGCKIPLNTPSAHCPRPAAKCSQQR